MDEKCILDPQRDCLGLQKANMLEKQMSEWREASRSTHKELFDRMRELEKAEAARNEQYDNIMEKLDRLIAWQEAEKAVGGHRGQVRMGGSGGCDCVYFGPHWAVKKRRPRRSAESP